MSSGNKAAFREAPAVEHLQIWFEHGINVQSLLTLPPNGIDCCPAPNPEKHWAGLMRCLQPKYILICKLLTQWGKIGKFNHQEFFICNFLAV